MDFELNSQQKLAVQDTEGAILVVAGAGSGKTRVLTARICHLIEMGVAAYNILAITFTNKAANEMKERIQRYIGDSGVWASTFHSMCAKMLRMDIDRLGYSSDFSIYTEIESGRVVKRILTDIPSGDPKKFGEFLWHISKAKSASLDPDDYYREIKNDVNNAGEICDVYRRYEEELRRSNSLDFDDLLVKTVELFETAPDVLEKYQSRFRYIHVDEFQDTNAIQYKLVKLLSAKWGNLFVVGDEDQSIYSWRGAEIDNILNFPKDFKGAKIYKLEQNYRSTTSILRAANNVIKNNVRRNDKTLWSDMKGDNSVEYYEAYSDRDEAEKVARAIDLFVSDGGQYKDTAVLVRANSLTRLFEEEFNLHGIPYKVFGGFRFFERKEIKDALAYVRLALNPSDNESFLRVINYPRRGVGQTTVDEMIRTADREKKCLYEVLTLGLLSPATQRKLAPFADIVNKLISHVNDMQPDEFMQYTIRISGLERALLESKDPDDRNRLDNIIELVSAVKEFVDDNKGATISDFMQSAALVSDTDEMDDNDYVTVATVHAVKGLEFDNVFIVAVEEGIFPTQRAITSGDIEEERRLMYVAITRARKKLIVINAKSRYRFGRVESLPKSRFVGEMSGVKQSIRYTNSNYHSTFGQDRIRLGANNAEASTYKSSDYAAKPSAKDIDYDKFTRNVRVLHRKFGAGVIVETSGEGDDKIAAIMFKGLGIKRFALAIAAPSLTIISDMDDGDFAD